MSIYEQDAQDIIRFLKHGDSLSCHNLVQRHQRAVYRVCLGILGDPYFSEEVTQDVFLKAFKKLKGLDEPKKFRAWLMRMAYRVALDHVRKKKHRFSPIDEERKIYDNTSSVEDLMDEDRKKELAMHLIQSLGNPDAAIFTMFYMEDMATEEISQALGITRSNVKVKLMRGREKLRQKVKNLKKT